MTDFKLHDKQSAPEKARTTLEGVEKTYGFIPNVLGVMAEAPPVLDAYATLSGLLGRTTFTPAEQQIAILAISHENGCEYCMAAHSMSAEKAGLPEDDIEAMRSGRPLDDERLETLRVFCARVVRERGWVAKDDLKAFLDAGYTQANVLEVILAVAMKTLSNYTNHIAETPLDEQLAPKEWKKAS